MGKPECLGEKPISQTQLMPNKMDQEVKSKGYNYNCLTLGLRKKNNKNTHRCTHVSTKKKKKMTCCR